MSPEPQVSEDAKQNAAKDEFSAVAAKPYLPCNPFKLSPLRKSTASVQHV